MALRSDLETRSSSIEPEANRVTFIAEKRQALRFRPAEIDIMFSIPFTRIIFLIISTGYLSYLALVIILQGSSTTFIIPKKVPTIKDGIILQLMNPKAYAFHSILFTGFIVFPENFLLETTWK